MLFMMRQIINNNYNDTLFSHVKSMKLANHATYTR